MRTPLLYKVYMALRRGWKRLTPETQMTLKEYVRSQKTENGYMNAGGHEDEYYRQFGRVLECVFCPIRLLGMKVDLTVQESRNSNTLYGTFFRFLREEMKLRHPLGVEDSRPSVLTTNSVCCILAMQKQTGRVCDRELLAWLADRQDETGGFYASEQAPIPDLLSTAVALFTLRLAGTGSKADASDFLQAHWRDGEGGFVPTIMDGYSDVEYVFYGLLGLGSI